MDKKLKILDFIHVLVTPSAKLIKTDRDYSAFTSILQHNISTLTYQLEGSVFNSLLENVKQLSSEGNAQWCFVQVNLILLNHLKEALDELTKKDILDQHNKVDGKPNVAPQVPSNVLSVQQEKVVGIALQFVVLLGIYPNLYPGVGIPVERRSGFVQLLCSNTNHQQNDSQLYECIMALLQCKEQPSLGTLIISKHLCDLLAGLLQLCFGSSTEQLRLAYAYRKTTCNFTYFTTSSTDAQQTTNLSPEAMAATEKADVLSQNDYGRCREQLDLLLERLYQPMLIQTLILLQGAPKTIAAQNKLQPAPAWLRSACGRLLSSRLLKTRGVISVVTAMLQCGGAGAAGAWQKYDMIARLIANVPRQADSAEEYYKYICPQLIGLLDHKDKTWKEEMAHVAARCIAVMWKQHKAPTECYLMNTIMKPLLQCTEPVALYTSQINTLVNEEQLNTCVEILYKIFVQKDPDAQFLQALVPVLHPLFSLWCFASQGVSLLRQPLKKILETFVKHVHETQALNCLKQFIFVNEADKKMENCTDCIPQMNPHICFSAGPEGGIVAVNVSSTKIDDLLADVTIKANCMVDFLQHLNAENLSTAFFIDVLKSVGDSVTEEHNQETSNSSEESGKLLLNIENQQQNIISGMKKSMMALSLLSAMCESLGPLMTKNKITVIEFSATVLQRFTSKDRMTDTEETDAETILMVCAMLTLLTEDKEMSYGDWQKMKEVLPYLNVIRSSHSVAFVREMTDELRIAIATHCAVPVDISKKFMKGNKSYFTEDQMKLEGDSSRTIDTEQVISESRESIHREQDMAMFERVIKEVQSLDTTDKLSESQQIQKEENNLSRKNSRSLDVKEQLKMSVSEKTTCLEYQEVWKDINNPLLPVRAGCLRSLAKLVRCKHPDAIANKDKLLSAFLDNLCDDDSYLYLSAVQGVEALADFSPDTVIPHLAEMFLNTSGKLSTCMHLKLGEVLMRASRDLG